MDELIKVIVDNGLGIGSFIALLVFIFKYQTKANETLDEISKSLAILNERIDKLENKRKECNYG